MCESDVYLVDGDEELLIMESVDVLESVGDDAWRLVDLFGEQKTVKGRFKQMSLVDHRIVFEA